MGENRQIGGEPVLPKHRPRLRIALGPENPEFGSWNWLGVDLSKELSVDHDVEIFREEIPEADVVVFFKFLCDATYLRALRARSAVIFCPVDVYESAAAIDADSARLQLCDCIVVHCRRLLHYFRSYSPTTYLDHHLKYVIPTRSIAVNDGPILWVGEQSNLPPLMEWIGRNELPSELVVLSNVNPTEVPSHHFRSAVRFELWSCENHLAWLKQCRCAFDVKANDFRARHKPPAKALDFLASGIPFAMSQPSSTVEHLQQLGFDVPAPNDQERWFSEDYAKDCQRFGRVISDQLSLGCVGSEWRAILNEVAFRKRNSCNRR